MFSSSASFNWLNFVALVSQLLPAETKQTLLWFCVSPLLNVVKDPEGVHFLWELMHCASQQNEKCSKGNDGECRSQSMLSAAQSYRRDAGRGGAHGSLNDFLPRPIQWKAHNGEGQSLHRTAGPESLWKQCNRAPRTHSHTFTHIHRCVTHGAQWTQSPSIWRSPVCLRRNSDMFPGTL